MNPYYRQRSVPRLMSVRSVVTTAFAYEDFITPVTDRGEEDLAHAQELIRKGYRNLSSEEQAEWDAGLKACQNVTDWNRIETDCRILSNVFELGLETKSWTYDDIAVSLEDYERIRQNVIALREAYIVHSDTPQAPDRPFNEYQKINAIEQILNDLYDIVNSNFYYYCGSEIYAGDMIGGVL